MPQLPPRLQVFAEAAPLLDHGFIRLVDVMGDDSAVVQAARVSYGAGTTNRSGDRQLIRYLKRQRHTTPFEMCEIKLHCKMPIFVARQWIRHRTASVNEVSGRYSILPPEFYLPQPEQFGVQSTTNKQGRGQLLTPQDASGFLALIQEHSAEAYRLYQQMLNDDGTGTPLEPAKPMVSKELARMVLGTNLYTEWYWKIDLHNLMHFLSLRLDPHAQYEIRVYAQAIADIIAVWCPDSWQAFLDYQFNAQTFSAGQVDVLQQIVKAHEAAHPGASARDLFRPLMDAAGIDTDRERLDTLRKLGVRPPGTS